MIRIGTVTGREVVKNRDGVGSRLILQVQMTNSDDVQSVELRNPAGEDNNPINGSQVIILDAGPAFKIATGVDDGIEPVMDPGEKRIYSLDSGGDVAAFINLLSSGIMEINGDTDFAVAFNDLKVAFDQLKTDLNNFITIYNTHTHPTAALGPPSVPSAPGSSSAADIDPAKVPTVKLP